MPAITFLLYNFFRFTGDFFRIYSFIILFQKIKQTKSVSGLSLKTQLLYLIVYLCRYLDIFYFNIFSFLNFYNFLMKIFYISIIIYLIYLIRFKYFYSYDLSFDNLNILNLIVPCLIFSIFLKSNTNSLFHYLFEYFYTFSIILESLAIIPQLLFIQNYGEAESLTSQYILFLGLYRIFYIFNWIFKFFYKGNINHLLLACGVIQAILYADFFMVYYQYVVHKKEIPRHKQ